MGFGQAKSQVYCYCEIFLVLLSWAVVLQSAGGGYDRPGDRAHTLPMASQPLSRKHHQGCWVYNQVTINHPLYVQSLLVTAFVKSQMILSDPK